MKPLTLSPRAHGIAEYVFFFARVGAAAYFAKKEPEAARAALLNAAIGAGVTMFTDMPGGVFKRISYENHLRFDTAYAPVIAALPHLFGVDHPSVRFAFYMDALTGGVVRMLSEQRPELPARINDTEVRATFEKLNEQQPI
jgi:hypothetical protein